MGLIGSLAGLILLQAAPLIQEEDPRRPAVEWPQDGRRPPGAQERTGTGWDVTPLFRLTFFEDGEAVDEVFDWGDLFSEGLGAALEVAHMWRGRYDWGLFLSAGLDYYRGDTSEDAVGDELDPEDLLMGAVLAGIKVQYELVSGFRIEARLGLGMAVYNEVKADAILSNVAFNDLEIYARSAAFAGEGGVRAVMGPLFLGTGLRYLGPPKKGADATDQLDPTESLSVILEAGFCISF